MRENMVAGFGPNYDNIDWGVKFPPEDKSEQEGELCALPRRETPTTDPTDIQSTPESPEAEAV